MNKIKEMMNKNKKAVFLLGSIACVGLASGGYVLLNNEPQEVLPVLEQIQESYTFEYGETISLDVEDYVIITDETLDKELVTFETEALVFVDENEYVEVGTYEMQVSYEEEAIDFTFVVEDTTAPEFSKTVDTLEIEEGEELDVLSNFEASDLSETTITVEGEVDVEVAGEYTVTVIASDTYENSVSHEVVVTVSEKEEVADTTTNNATNNNTTANNSTTPSTSTSGSTSSNSSSSSNNSSSSSTSTPDKEVCAYAVGTPHPDQIGNSGLVFTSRQEYSDWFDWVMSDDPETGRYVLMVEYGQSGFDGWTMQSDICGNMYQDLGLEYWTVHWNGQ